MRLGDIPRADSDVAQLATEVVAEFHSAAMLNHCLRSYLWAASYGMLYGISFDVDLLHVSAMLHDLGLAADFDNHTLGFEYAGGNVAWVFGAGAGWPVHRRRRAAEIVVRHMWDDVDPRMDPEGHLLERATSLDISGRRTQQWPDELRTEVIEHIPRLI